jgi:alkanesulfonate monooxygenase SsuD/methylene tetrahydromethanopterin reductase-like flavin-dependent oxidoreductase (luciferase family)
MQRKAPVSDSTTHSQVSFADRLQFGFVVEGDEPGAARHTELMGADSLWAGGHLASTPPSPEAIVGLARLAVESERALVGTAALLLPAYPPGIVAKQVAEVDRISSGRVVLGIGVGGEYESDFKIVQVPLGGRGRRADEAITVLRALWSGQAVSHPGPLFPMSGVRIHPGPVQRGGPPIVVAGRQAAAMRRAVRAGDGWMPYMYSPERFARSAAEIRRLAEDSNRDLTGFGWFTWLTAHVRTDGALARHEAAAYLSASTGQDFGQLVDRVALVGDPAEVLDRLRAYVGAGVRHFVFAPIPGDRFETPRRLMGDILPALRESSRAWRRQIQPNGRLTT